MEYVFFAGANGSGKSTLIKNLRSLDEYQGFRYICADELENEFKTTQDKVLRMEQARDLAMVLRENGLNEGQNLIYESVASHPSHLADLDRIKAMGYKITTVYVTTESPEINLARIAKRGRDNDTYLTPERVKRRYAHSLDLLSELIKRSDMAFAYDNSINYFAVFYKTPDGKNYLIGEKEWANRYIVEKLQKEGLRVFAAKDMDQETYIRLLNQANRLITPKDQSSAKKQNNDMREPGIDKPKVMSREDQMTAITGVCKNKIDEEIIKDKEVEHRQAEQFRQVEQAEQARQVRQVGANSLGAKGKGKAPRGK